MVAHRAVHDVLGSIVMQHWQAASIGHVLDIVVVPVLVGGLGQGVDDAVENTQPGEGNKYESDPQIAPDESKQ